MDEHDDPVVGPESRRTIGWNFRLRSRSRELDSLSRNHGLRISASSIPASSCCGVLSSEIEGDWRGLGEIGGWFRWTPPGAYRPDA